MNETGTRVNHSDSACEQFETTQCCRQQSWAMTRITSSPAIVIRLQLRDNHIWSLESSSFCSMGRFQMLSTDGIFFNWLKGSQIQSAAVTRVQMEKK